MHVIVGIRNFISSFANTPARCFVLKCIVIVKGDLERRRYGAPPQLFVFVLPPHFFLLSKATVEASTIMVMSSSFISLFYSTLNSSSSVLFTEYRKLSPPCRLQFQFPAQLAIALIHCGAFGNFKLHLNLLGGGNRILVFHHNADGPACCCAARSPNRWFGSFLLPINCLSVNCFSFGG